MNRFRLITTGFFLAFIIYCVAFDNSLPFELPLWVYILATIYLAFFPIKDMISCFNNTLYKGRQFNKNYVRNLDLESTKFKDIVRRDNKRALYSLIFWIIFMAVPCTLFLTGVIDRIWIVLFFAISNFSVFFAVFFWCPFRSIFIKPDCCMECRIYNWDSFFQYSFLIFIPNVFTIILFILGALSLLEWEFMHAKYPERFYKISNLKIKCENCDLDACCHHKKIFFTKRLKETIENSKE